MITNNISYTGSVKVKLLKGKRVKRTYTIHNEGTQLLFQGIALSLIQSESSKLLPNYIAIGLEGGELSDSYRLLNEIVRVPITSKNVLSNTFIDPQHGQMSDGYKAIFSATIPASSLFENTIREIGLFGQSSGDNLLARITPPINDPIVVETGMSITIEWTTLIKNGYKE